MFSSSENNTRIFSIGLGHLDLGYYTKFTTCTIKTHDYHLEFRIRIFSKIGIQCRIRISTKIVHYTNTGYYNKL